MKQYNVGIVGYGWVATAHIPAINATPLGQVTAVCSSRKLDAAALRGILRSDQRLSALAGILKPRAFETLGDASRRLLDSVL